MVHFNKKFIVDGKTYNVNGERFENISEFKKTNASRTKLRNSFDPDDIDTDFTGVKSYDEAINLLTTGYKEALENFNTLLKLRGKKKKKVTFKNDVQGFVPIVPHAIMGLPQSMINTHITKIKTPVIDIYYDPRFSCNADRSDFIDAGRKMLSSIFQLEKSGVKINLYYCNFKTEKNSSYLDVCVLKLKDSNRPLDINRITFPIAHPAMLRVFSFEWMSKVPNGKYRDGYGDGFVVSYNKNIRKNIIDNTFGKNARYFHAEDVHDMSIDNIIEVIKNG